MKKNRHSFKKRFSIAHPETNMEESPNHFYLTVKQTPQETLDEIEDIYFGKFFYFEIDGIQKRYGNCMGVEATTEQVTNLFKIQEETGVQISLTLNALEIPIELQTMPEAVDSFVEWIGEFYDRGLRSCTIAWTHLIRSGLLQKRCPEMRWKNTVNHLVSDTQQVVEFIHLGYDTILLDRSFNRNLVELKRTKKVIDKYNKIRKEKNPDAKELKTSLLVSEGCLYRCPFKKEHDDIGSTISVDYFETLSNYTCDNWRNPQFSKLPRNGIDIAANHVDTINKYLDNVDILKYSGRLTSLSFMSEMDIVNQNIHFAWIFGAADKAASEKFKLTEIEGDTLVISETFKHVYDLDAAPLSLWKLNQVMGHNYKDHYIDSAMYDRVKKLYLTDNFWLSDEGKRLEDVLVVCKSQCYHCHECERAFGVDDIDSALEYEMKNIKVSQG